MERYSWLLWLLTITSTSCSVAALVGTFLKPGSAFASLRKRTLCCETDIAALESEFGRMKALLKSISQRTAMVQAREKLKEEANNGDDRPVDAMTKDELRRKFLRGSHIDIARRAMGNSAP